MLMALLVENIIAIDVIGAFLAPFLIILAIIIVGLSIGPQTKGQLK